MFKGGISPKVQSFTERLDLQQISRLAVVSILVSHNYRNTCELLVLFCTEQKKPDVYEVCGLPDSSSAP